MVLLAGPGSPMSYHPLSAKQSTTGGVHRTLPRLFTVSTPPQNLHHPREAGQQDDDRLYRDIVGPPHDLSVARYLWGLPGVNANDGRSRVRGRYLGHLGWSPQHARVLGQHPFLAFARRWGGGVKPPLGQHLNILGHAIVTIAARGLPQDAAVTHAVRAHVDPLPRAFNPGATTLHDHIMDYFAVADRPVNHPTL